MILDGGTILCSLSNGDRFLCRPFRKADRAAIKQTLEGVPEILGQQLIADLVESRIVKSEFETDIREWPDELCDELMRITFGVGRDEQEVADEANLRAGTVLATRTPWLAKVSCEQCGHYWYDPLVGRTAKRDGVPLRRIPGTPLACDSGRCPKGHWSNPVQFTERNALAFQWCSTRPPSSDPVDARNREVINDAVQSAKGSQRTDGAAGGRGRPTGEHGDAAGGRAGTGIRTA